MANEYRIYAVNTEVVHEGALGDMRFYALQAEVVHDGDPVTTRHIYHLSVEIVRDLRDKYSPDTLVAEDDQVFAGFTFQEAFTWEFIEDSDVVYAPQLLVPPATALEWNPFRPDVPYNLADSDPNSYNYLREQAEILREQHDLSQAGGTTFPWQLAVQTSAHANFQLGSLSRFYHPTYGMMLARYVQFSPRWESGLHAPVGQDLRYGDWVVTNRYEHSHWSRMMGVSLTFDRNPAGLYGWVFVQGHGIVSIQIESATRPAQFDGLTWVGTGKLGYGVGKVLARILDSEGLIHAGGNLWGGPDTTWFCEIDGITDTYIQQLLASQFTVIDNRLDALEAIEIPDYAPQFQVINEALASQSAALQTESQIRAQTDRSFSNRIRALEAAESGAVTVEAFNALAGRVTTIEEITVPQVEALASTVSSLSATVSDHSTSIATLTSQTGGLLESVNAIILSFNTIDSFGDVDTSTTPPTDGQALLFDAGDSLWKPGAVADVFGPAGATDKAIVRFDTATGKLVQDSLVVVTDAGRVDATGFKAALDDYVDDAAAAIGGVEVDEFYRNGSVVMVRVS